LYYLKVLKDYGYMERKRNSDIMIMSVDSFLPDNLIIPICVDNWIISEAKVVQSNLFNSQIKIILHDDRPLIPHFEVINEDNVIYTKLHDAITKKANTENEFIYLCDLRPVNFPLIKTLCKDILDYEGLSNLRMNVRFKEGEYQY